MGKKEDMESKWEKKVAELRCQICNLIHETKKVFRESHSTPKERSIELPICNTWTNDERKCRSCGFKYDFPSKPSGSDICWAGHKVPDWTNEEHECPRCEANFTPNDPNQNFCCFSCWAGDC